MYIFQGETRSFRKEYVGPSSHDNAHESEYEESAIGDVIEHDGGDLGYGEREEPINAYRYRERNGTKMVWCYFSGDLVGRQISDEER